MARGRRRRSGRPEITAPGFEHRPHEQASTTGPWDSADAPEDGQERIDLGAVQIPAVPGYELRVEVSPEGQVVAATLASPRGEMQLGVFAAPRSAGIWDEVRGEIQDSLRTQGGSVQEQDGPFGVELAGRVPATGGSGTMPARFVGVDGPRWFLRALFLGPVATDPVQVKPLEEALRDVVIVRGADPLPVREGLPLRLPRDVAEQLAAQGEPSFLEQHDEPPADERE